MPEAWLSTLSTTIVALSLVTAAALLFGFAFNTLKWAKEVLLDAAPSAYRTYRRGLARTVLIGLELLLAITIVKTITVPATAEELGLLLAMAAIRTAIGWTTSLELNGRWPWLRR